MIESLLINFFKLAELHALNYLVMRNYERYPVAWHKPDMSLLIDIDHQQLLISIFCDACMSLGLFPSVKPSRTNSIVLKCFYSSDESENKTCFAFKIDARTYEVFQRNTFENLIPAFNRKIFINQVNIVLLKQYDLKLQVLAQPDEFVFMLKQWRRKQLPHYSERINHFLKETKVQDLLGNLELKDNFSIDEFLINPESNDYAFLLSKAMNRCWGKETKRDWLISFWKSVCVIFSRKKIAPVIYFSGPDGCGKTTICDGLKAIYTESKIPFKYFYTYQKLLRYIGLRLLWVNYIIACDESPRPGFREYVSRGTGVQDRNDGHKLWRIRKRCILLFSFIDMWISWPIVMVLRLCGYAVIVETSPYDLFTKYHMPSFPLLDKIISKLMPRPSIGFLLQATPADVVKRKAELNEEEIHSYYRKFDDIVSNISSSNYNYIDTSSGVDSTLIGVLKIVALNKTSTK